MKTWLAFRRALTEGIGFNAYERDLAYGPRDVIRPAALLRWVLDRGHSVRSMFPDLTVFPMNDELAGAILFDGLACGVDGFILSGEHLPRFTFPLHLPISARRKHVDR